MFDPIIKIFTASRSHFAPQKSKIENVVDLANKLLA
jgi:hypothetical protein